MTTATDVFNIAMSLMDEINEATNLPNESDTAEYKARTLFILNALRGELYPLSDTFKYAKKDGKRSIAVAITDWSSAINLDDDVCQSILPYGLAAHLLTDENPQSANFFMQRYEEGKARLQKGVPTVSEDIVDIYDSGDDYGYSGRW